MVSYAEMMKDLLKANEDQGVDKGDCFVSSSEFMLKCISKNVPSMFVCMYVPLADQKKPGIHFVVANNTDSGIVFVDKNARFLDDEGKMQKGTVTLQSDYLKSLAEAAKQLDIPRFDFCFIKWANGS